MTPATFVAKWSRVDLPERAASQEHFIDLCRLLGQPTPAEHDATGAEYAFEKGVEVVAGASKGAKGDRGFADVWWKGKFGWEYKRKDKYKTLDEAYRQLLQYREALESPPLLIVSDIGRTEIHTNFTGTKKEIHSIALADMDQPRSLDLLRRVFNDPDSFRPKVTAERVTQDVAKHLGVLAQALRDRGHDPHVAAHFLMKCMFCLFAEDVLLLPKDLFKTLLEKYHNRPKDLTPRLTALFDAMRTGGAFGTEDIAWFNGGLFDKDPALELTETEIGLLIVAAAQEWGSVEPAIFGTLFERSLDPAKRSQIGAHYTSRADILLVIEPVIMEPLRLEWGQVQDGVAKLLEKRRDAAAKAKMDKKAKSAVTKATQAIEHVLQEFTARLSSLRVLDPACGSGNFLYVAIQRLLDLEKEVITFAARPEIALGLLPRVRPTQLLGIEINPYAAELAQVVIWIGYLQWMRENGFKPPSDPVLASLTTIENRDAILTIGNYGVPLPRPAEWPKADFIIGNPPFAGRGTKRGLLTKAFGDKYVDTLNAAYEGYLKAGADLCCYWFELAHRQVAEDRGVRAGLLATQGIRGGTNNEVLERICASGRIFWAEADRDWVLDGATVHVSMVGFDVGGGTRPLLDGIEVEVIHPDLTTGTNATETIELEENEGWAFQGVIPLGPFDMDAELAIRMLEDRGNPNDKPNSDVLRWWANGEDFLDSRSVRFVLDFNDMSLEKASNYAAPFKYAHDVILPERQKGETTEAVNTYWRLWRARPKLRKAIASRCPSRFIVVPRVSKHQVFAWADARTLPSDATVAIATESVWVFGLLHSSIHNLWAGRKGTQLREEESGRRYSHTFTFNTFPFPWPLGREPRGADAVVRPVEGSAAALHEAREGWLNPPEWIAPIAARVDSATRFADVPEAARPLIRHSAIMAAAAHDSRLTRRTLTNLYNERPTWLRLAHEKLDRAVLAAYAAIDPEGGWDESWAEVWTETGAGQPFPAGHAMAGRRAEVEERVLANLLRLNQERGKPKTPGCPHPPG
jgi:hypothetical protein